MGKTLKIGNTYSEYNILRFPKRLTISTHQLLLLQVGDHVGIQIQIGPKPRKWGKIGLVIEFKQFSQYAIRFDGSDRVMLGNRKFLRKFIPVIIHRSNRLTLLQIPFQNYSHYTTYSHITIPYHKLSYPHPFQNQSCNANLHSIQDQKQHQLQQMLKHRLPQVQDLLKVHG